jgi:hypothetical protein
LCRKNEIQNQKSIIVISPSPFFGFERESQGVKLLHKASQNEQRVLRKNWQKIGILGEVVVLVVR